MLFFVQKEGEITKYINTYICSSVQIETEEG